MEKSIARTTWWMVVAVLLSPLPLAWGDEPAEQASATEIAAAAEHTPASEVVADEVPLSQQPLFRFESYPAAWTAAQTSNRPILVYVSMPNCPHCTHMLDSTFESQGVSDLVKGSFETMHASRYQHTTLISKLHVRWYPTTVLVGSNNKVLDVIEGYVDANTFKQRLQLGLAAAHSDTQTR
jgi:hypothetical protein